MKCCVLNAQSLRNKSADFIDYICDFKPDIVAVTETWFKEIDSAAKIEATLLVINYLIIHVLAGLEVARRLCYVTLFARANLQLKF